MKIKLKPIALVYRISSKTRNCRQIPFTSIESLKAWSNRKPYCNEVVRVQVVKDRRIILDDAVTAPNSAELVEHAYIINGLIKELQISAIGCDL